MVKNRVEREVLSKRKESEQGWDWDSVFQKQSEFPTQYDSPYFRGFLLSHARESVYMLRMCAFGTSCGYAKCQSERTGEIRI